MSKYKFLLLNTETDKLTGFKPNITTPEQVGRALLNKQMKLENDTVESFLLGWSEHLTEINSDGEKFEPNQIADTVADFIIYGSNFHIIQASNRTEVSNEFRTDAYDAIVRKLESSFD